MFYTYILRSLSQPEHRYIGSTADLQARLAIRRFFLLAKNKRSETERAKDARKFILRSFMRRRKLLATEGYTAQNRRKTYSTHTFCAASPTRNSVISAVQVI